MAHKLTSLGEIEEWRHFELTPANWAARLRLLRNLFRPARPDPAVRGGWELWRSQAAALDLFDKALDEAAQSMEPRHGIALDAVLARGESGPAIEAAAFERWAANVVHVLSAHEARQWVLPVVFVCGLVEKQFPQFHPQDLFFPDAARTQLNNEGIRVRTVAETEREERGLFDSALTRATMLVSLSYPQSDARGERNLRSGYLENWSIEERKSRAVRLRPRASREATAAAAGIRAPASLAILRRANRESVAHVARRPTCSVRSSISAAGCCA